LLLLLLLMLHQYATGHWPHHATIHAAATVAPPAPTQPTSTPRTNIHRQRGSTKPTTSTTSSTARR
jgi:hypothetical protein